GRTMSTIGTFDMVDCYLSSIQPGQAFQVADLFHLSRTSFEDSVHVERVHASVSYEVFFGVDVQVSVSASDMLGTDYPLVIRAITATGMEQLQHVRVAQVQREAMQFRKSVGLMSYLAMCLRRDMVQELLILPTFQRAAVPAGAVYGPASLPPQVVTLSYPHAD